MKKLFIGFVFSLSFILFGCGNNDIQTSLIGSNPEEAPVLQTSERLDSPIEIEKEAEKPNDFPEAEISEDVVEDVEINTDRAPIEVKKAENENSIPDENFINNLFPSYDSIEDTTVIERKYKTEDESEVFLEEAAVPAENSDVADLVSEENDLATAELQIEEALSDELLLPSVQTDSDQAVSVESETDEAFEEAADNPNSEVSEEILTETDSSAVSEQIIEDSSEPGIGTADEDSEEFAHSAPKEAVVYHPNRSDLDDFYQTLQSNSKIITPNFSFFCGKSCETFNLSKADAESLSVVVSYTVEGTPVSFVCNKTECQMQIDPAEEVSEDSLSESHAAAEKQEESSINSEITEPSLFIDNPEIETEEILNPAVVETPEAAEEVVAEVEARAETEVETEAAVEAETEVSSDSETQTQQEEVEAPRRIRIKRK